MDRHYLWRRGMASISDNPDVDPFRGTSKEEREESGRVKSRGRRLLAAEHLKIGYEVDGQLHIAVEDVSFEVWPNEKVMLIGPSGCGKSTLLKTVAGFLQPVGGSISIAGRDSLEPGPDRAVVFQEFDQLFPWRTVIDNVVYPLRVVRSEERRVGKECRSRWS